MLIVIVLVDSCRKEHRIAKCLVAVDVAVHIYRRTAVDAILVCVSYIACNVQAHETFGTVQREVLAADGLRDLSIKAGTC